jgi:hypothetical protein
VKNPTAHPPVTLFMIGGAACDLPQGPQRRHPDTGSRLRGFATRIGSKCGALDAREMAGPDGRQVRLDIDPARVNYVDMTSAT